MNGDLPPPLPLAMVICDGIWQDPSTHKTTLLGMFSEIKAPSFPTTHPIIALHVELTDGHGTIPVKVQLVDVDEEYAPLFAAKSDLTFADRRTIVSLNMHLQGIVFPRPGEYRFQLFARGELLLERRLIARQTGDPPHAE